VVNFELKEIKWEKNIIRDKVKERLAIMNIKMVSLLQSCAIISLLHGAEQ
jgi:hypothetical protein